MGLERILYLGVCHMHLHIKMSFADNRNWLCLCVIATLCTSFGLNPLVEICSMHSLALCAVDRDGESEGDVEDGVDVRGDHPAARRLGEHELPADPGGEEGEEQPEAEGQQEEHPANHLGAQKL